MALIHRAPTFLADEGWKVIPWSAGASTKSSLQYLIDVVVDIPAYLAQADRFLDLVQSSSIPDSTELRSLQETLTEWIARLYRRLRQWKELWVDSAVTSQVFEVSSLVPEPFPTFRCRDPTTMTIMTPKLLAYDGPVFASAMCTYYAVNLILAAADVRPAGTMPLHEQYAFACDICRSTEYFICNAPGQMILRFGFPLRIAYENLPYGGIERQYVEEVFRLIGQRYSLKLFSSLMPEVTGRKRTL